MFNSDASRPGSLQETQALAILELRRRERLQREELGDFVPRLTPRFASPRHLSPLLALFERMRRGERVLAVVSTPPRHGKTETLVHGMAYLLAHRPGTQITYVSYGTTFAEDKSRKARQIAIDAGVPISPLAWSRKNWRTGVDDGGLWATAIAGQITGQGFHVMVIDDPVKDRATAESVTQRQHHYEWFTDTAYTRLEPNGSCIVNMARWHEDDLAGRLIRDGWEHVNLKAIGDDGAALWPERWPLERLLELRATLGEYGFCSLYQGEPRPRGGAVFRDVVFYDALPKKFRVAIGIDLAYTAKTYSDYCVAVVLAEADGVIYVLDVKRAQATPPDFAATLRQLRTAYPGAQWLWHTSTTEQGLADLLRSECGFPIAADVVKADKFVRAQPVAAAWNDGKVLLPGPKLAEDGSVLVPPPQWTADFTAEVCAFTGVGDRHDDQVDALAAAFDMIARGAGLRVPTSVRTKFDRFGGNPFTPSGDIKWR